MQQESEKSKETKPSRKSKSNQQDELSFREFSNRVAGFGLLLSAVVMIWNPLPFLVPLVDAIFLPLLLYWLALNGLPFAWKHRRKIGKSLVFVMWWIGKKKPHLPTLSIPTTIPGLSPQTRTALPAKSGWEGPLPAPFDGLPVNQNRLSSPPMKFDDASDFISEGLRLAGFNVEENVTVLDITSGPTLQQVSVQLPPKIQLTQIIKQQDNLANHLDIETGLDIFKPNFKSSVAFTIPHEQRSFVYLRDLAEDFIAYAKNAALPMIIGKDLAGNPKFCDLATLPHLLIAGETGSGKSVGINGMTTSMMMVRSPEEVQYLMIDPKMVELSVYNGSPHLMRPVITNMEEVIEALDEIVEDMDIKYSFLMDEGVRNIVEYNKIMASRNQPLMKYTVVIIDEFSDLKDTVGDAVDLFIKRLVQKARAVGIHLILGTQSPRADVITGIIKANIPGRICFAVSGSLEYQITMNSKGESYPMLMGKGDGMAKLNGKKKFRFQSAAIGNDSESTDYIRKLKKYALHQTRNDLFAMDTGHVEVTSEPDSWDQEKDEEDVPVVEKSKPISLKQSPVAAIPIQKKLDVLPVQVNSSSIEQPHQEVQTDAYVELETDEEEELNTGIIVYSASRSGMSQPDPTLKQEIENERFDSRTPLMRQALAIAEEMGGLSMTLLESRLKIKMSQAIQILKSLQEQGLLGPMDSDSNLMPYFSGEDVKLTQEDVYNQMKLMIAREGVVNTSKIRDSIKVRRQRISDTLKRLVDEGFLEITSKRPDYRLAWDEEEVQEYLDQVEKDTFTF